MEIYIYLDLLKAINWLFNASNHSSIDYSLAALWAIQLWLDATPDMRIILHHINKDIGMDVHSLVHFFMTSIRVEAEEGPVRTFHST